MNVNSSHAVYKANIFAEICFMLLRPVIMIIIIAIFITRSLGFTMMLSYTLLNLCDWKKASSRLTVSFTRQSWLRQVAAQVHGCTHAKTNTTNIEL